MMSIKRKIENELRNTQKFVNDIYLFQIYVQNNVCIFKRYEEATLYIVYIQQYYYVLCDNSNDKTTYSNCFFLGSFNLIFPAGFGNFFS